MNLKKLIAILVLLGTLFNVLANASPHQKTINVLLDWIPNPNQAPIWIAQYKDYYAQAGLNVKIMTPADPADVPKMIASHQADVGLDYEISFKQQVTQGLPIAIIGTLIPRPLNAIMVLKNSNIHSVKDLKNKLIGYSNANDNHTILKMMLQHHQLTLKDVKLINVHYGLITSLLTRRVDAVTDIMRNVEPFEIQKYHAQIRLLLPEKNGVPNYHEIILITHKDRIKDPAIKRFLQATQKGLNYTLKHPQSAWHLFAAHHPASNNTTMKKIWFETLKYFGSNIIFHDTIKQTNLP